MRDEHRTRWTSRTSPSPTSRAPGSAAPASSPALPAGHHPERDRRPVPGHRADLGRRRLGRRRGHRGRRSGSAAGCSTAPATSCPTRWSRPGRPTRTAASPSPEDPRGAASYPGFRGYARVADGRAGEFAICTLKPGRVPDGEGGLQAPHIDVSLFARGLLDRVVTRIYFADEAEANAEDVVLRRLPDDRRAHADRRRRPTTATASTSTCRVTARPCSSRYELLRDQDARRERTLRRHLRARGSGRRRLRRRPGSGPCSRSRPRSPGRPPGSGLVPTTAADAVTAACADPGRLDLATVVAKAADAGNPVPPLVRGAAGRGGRSATPSPCTWARPARTSSTPR